MTSSLRHAADVLAVFCLAGGSAGALAQGQEVPPPEESSLDPSAPTAPAARPAPWTLAVRLQESWEEEPRFAGDGTTEAASSLVDVAGASLRYSSQGRRGRLAASIDGTFRRYHEQSRSDDLFYGLALDGSYRLSSRMVGSFTESLVSSYPRQSAFLLQSGLVLPYVRTLTNNTAADVSQRLSATTSISMEARYQSVWFDSPSLVDGSFLTLRPSLRKQTGPSSFISLSYSLDRNRNAVDDDSMFHSVFVTWRTVLEKALTLRLSAGATYLPQDALPTSRLTPYGAADITWRGRRGFVNGTYERAVSQAWSLGVPRTADIGSLTVDVSPSRRLGAFASGVYSLSRDLRGAVFHFTSVSATTGIRLRITRQLRLQSSYSQWRTTPSEPGATRFRSQSVGLSASYEAEWR